MQRNDPTAYQRLDENKASTSNFCYAWADNARATQTLGQSCLETLFSCLGSCCCTIPCGIVALAIHCDSNFKGWGEEKPGDLCALSDPAQCGSNTGVIIERLGMRALGCVAGLPCAIPTVMGNSCGNDCICCGTISKEQLEATPAVHEKFPKKLSIFTLEACENFCSKCNTICCSCCIEAKKAFCDERPQTGPTYQKMS